MPISPALGWLRQEDSGSKASLTFTLSETLSEEQKNNKTLTGGECWPGLVLQTGASEVIIRSDCLF